MNLAQMVKYRPKWDWKGMEGSAACLKWGFRDLQNLEEALPLALSQRVAVQAGGNLGLFPKRLSETFETVYAFEPDPDLFLSMCRNAPERNIVKLQAALGFDRTPISMRCSRRDDSGRAVHEGLTHVAGPGVVPQIALDDLNLHACDLIYLDVEGYELNALRGAVNTINLFKPVIVVEINKNIQHYGSTGDELRQWLYALRYERVRVVNSDETFVHRG